MTWGKKREGVKGPIKQGEDAGWMVVLLAGFSPLSLQKELQRVSPKAPRLTCPHRPTTQQKTYLPPIFAGFGVPEWACFLRSLILGLARSSRCELPGASAAVSWCGAALKRSESTFLSQLDKAICVGLGYVPVQGPGLTTDIHIPGV